MSSATSGELPTPEMPPLSSLHLSLHQVQCSPSTSPPPNTVRSYVRGQGDPYAYLQSQLRQQRYPKPTRKPGPQPANGVVASSLGQREQTIVQYMFPGWCYGCRLCYGCPISVRPHLHREKPMRTGGGFTYLRRDVPKSQGHLDMIPGMGFIDRLVNTKDRIIPLPQWVLNDIERWAAAYLAKLDQDYLHLDMDSVQGRDYDLNGCNYGLPPIIEGKTRLNRVMIGQMLDSSEMSTSTSLLQVTLPGIGMETPINSETSSLHFSDGSRGSSASRGGDRRHSNHKRRKKRHKDGSGGGGAGIGKRRNFTLPPLHSLDFPGGDVSAESKEKDITARRGMIILDKAKLRRLAGSGASQLAAACEAAELYRLPNIFKKDEDLLLESDDAFKDLADALSDEALIKRGIIMGASQNLEERRRLYELARPSQAGSSPNSQQNHSYTPKKRGVIVGYRKKMSVESSSKKRPSTRQSNIHRPGGLEDIHEMDEQSESEWETEEEVMMGETNAEDTAGQEIDSKSNTTIESTKSDDLDTNGRDSTVVPSSPANSRGQPPNSAAFSRKSSRERVQIVDDVLLMVRPIVSAVREPSKSENTSGRVPSQATTSGRSSKRSLHRPKATKKVLHEKPAPAKQVYIPLLREASKSNRVGPTRKAVPVKKPLPSIQDKKIIEEDNSDFDLDDIDLSTVSSSPIVKHDSEMSFNIDSFTESPVPSSEGQKDHLEEEGDDDDPENARSVRRKRMMKMAKKHRAAQPKRRFGGRPLTKDELKAIYDPLDYLAKYCIIEKNRLPIYESTFKAVIEIQKAHRPRHAENEKPKYVEDIEVANRYGSPDKKPSKNDRFDQLKKKIAYDAASYQESLGKNVADNLYEKVDFKVKQISERINQIDNELPILQHEMDALIAEIVRQEFPEVLSGEYHFSKKSKSTSKQPVKTKGLDDNGPTIPVMSDKEILLRMDKRLYDTIQQLPRVTYKASQVKYACKKRDELLKRLEDLQSDRIELDAYGMEIQDQDNKTIGPSDDLKRRQSIIYQTVHPKPNLVMNVTEVEDALQTINNNLLSKKECQFVHHILNLPSRNRINMQMFSCVAALSEKVTQLEPFTRKLINKFDFEALDWKMEKSKELFYLLADHETNDQSGSVSVNTLIVELRAGGVTDSDLNQVAQKFDREDKGFVEFLDFLTYVPLFVEIHAKIVSNPLKQAENIFHLDEFKA